MEHTRINSVRKGSAMSSAVRQFIEESNPVRNLRSLTGVRDLGNQRVHFKYAEFNLLDEAEALVIGDAIQSIDSVRSITPLAFDEESNVLVTEYVDGQSLFNVMWNRTSVWRRWRYGAIDWSTVFGSVGEWLAVFHDSTLDKNNKCLPSKIEKCQDRIFNSMKAKLDLIVKKGDQKIGINKASLILKVAENILKSEEWKDLPRCRIHGDFSIINMLMLRDQTVRVLDFADSRNGFALEDVVRLWTTVWELTNLGKYKDKCFSPCMNQLLQSYGLPLDIMQTEIFGLLRLWNAVTRICESSVIGDKMPFRTRLVHQRLVTSHSNWLDNYQYLRQNGAR